MAAAAAAAAKPKLQNLICRTVPSFRHILPADTRVAALDVTRRHVSIALSDPSRTRAAPFGVLSRINPTADARLLQPALEPLSISGLIIGVSPSTTPDIQFIEELIANETLPDLHGILFYSEAHALKRAISACDDFVDASKMLPQLETRKRGRFIDAMNPRVSHDDLETGFRTRATISATEILQAALEDLNK